MQAGWAGAAHSEEASRGAGGSQGPGPPGWQPGGQRSGARGRGRGPHPGGTREALGVLLLREARTDSQPLDGRTWCLFSLVSEWAWGLQSVWQARACLAQSRLGRQVRGARLGAGAWGHLTQEQSQLRKTQPIDCLGAGWGHPGSSLPLLFPEQHALGHPVRGRQRTSVTAATSSCHDEHTGPGWTARSDS